MRRDSIFYQLFQQYPALLFELLNQPPANAANYSFDAVAVKEPRFEIDGVFLPPENDSPGTVYFCEVQFQKDEQLYERVFAESLLYFYRNRERFSDWQVVVIYPTRRMEQGETHPYRSLLNGEQVQRVYLNELGDIRELPIPSALLVLTTLEPEQAATEARYLLSRTEPDAPAEAQAFASQTLVDIVTTIMVYRYEGLSQREVEQMLGISLQETQVYREIKAEGREEGREEGRAVEARSLIFRLLARRLGELPEMMLEQVQALSLERLEDLGEALLDFAVLADLKAWLDEAAGAEEALD
jgi:predicted transposase/invertase (TIGR01784 family)